jgi:hypothetical protein
MAVLFDENWGVKASLDLLSKNWVVVGCAMLASAAAELYTPSQRYFSIGGNFPPLDPAGLLLAILVTVGLLWTFLRDQGVIMSKKGLMLAALICLCMELFWNYIPSLSESAFSQGFNGAWAIQTIGKPFALISLLVLAFYTFCLLPQIGRDGHFSFQQMVIGINRRGWRWVGIVFWSMLIFCILSWVVEGLFRNPVEAGDQRSSEIAAGVIDALYIWLGAFYTAVGVVWLLNPRADTTELPASWPVPSSLEA